MVAMRKLLICSDLGQILFFMRGRGPKTGKFLQNVNYLRIKAGHKPFT